MCRLGDGITAQTLQFILRLHPLQAVRRGGSVGPALILGEETPRSTVATGSATWEGIHFGSRKHQLTYDPLHLEERPSADLNVPVSSVHPHWHLRPEYFQADHQIQDGR